MKHEVIPVQTVAHGYTRPGRNRSPQEVAAEIQAIYDKAAMLGGKVIDHIMMPAESSPYELQHQAAVHERAYTGEGYMMFVLSLPDDTIVSESVQSEG